LHCPKVFEGELTCGEEGRAVPEAVEMLRRWNCETAASLFIVDGGRGAGEAGPIPMFGEELSMANTTLTSCMPGRENLWSRYGVSSLCEVLRSSTMMLSCSIGTPNFGRVRPRPLNF
jgi:hypothetical protein